MFGSGSLKVGRIAGIDIEIHASWLVVFALVWVTLATSVFPGVRDAERPALIDFAVAFVTAALFFSSVLAHELAHSIVGRAFGVRIERITLFIFGGLAQMSGEAREPKAEFLMALAGPAASVFVAVLFGLGAVVAGLVAAPGWVGAPLTYLAVVNVVLALFNLVPGFPLDGGRVLRSVLWTVLGDQQRATRIATRLGQAFAGLLIAYGATRFIFRADPVDGFWLILIGLFLYSAASSSYQQVAIGEALAGVRVAEIMTREVVAAPAHIMLEDLVADYFFRHRHGRFPVVDDGRIVGTVTLNDVRAFDRDRWGTVAALEAAAPISERSFIDADAPALSALLQMAESGTGQLLVRSSGAVVGIVTRSDVMKAVSIRGSLAS